MTKIKPDIQYWDLESAPYKAMMDVRAALKSTKLPNGLLELVFLRVSELNGCSYCIKLHSAEAHRTGVDQRLIENLGDWRKDQALPSNTAAALAWAEAVTTLFAGLDRIECLNDLRGHFSDAEVTELTVAVSQMNAMNRMAISLSG